jgi:biotin operon repressor
MRVASIRDHGAMNMQTLREEGVQILNSTEHLVEGDDMNAH